MKHSRAERNECDTDRFCIFVTITLNSKLIICRRRGMVSRWLPYLRGTVSTAAHASLDKGLSLWSSYDTLSSSQEPPPHSLHSPSLFPSALFFTSIHLSLLSCPSNAIWHHLSSSIHIQHSFMSNHVHWSNTHSSKPPPFKVTLYHFNSSTLRGFKVEEQALESWSDLMLLTDQTDSKRKWKLCKPREHL